jgi:limonene-1,2-epoxide hydrolase
MRARKLFGFLCLATLTVPLIACGKLQEPDPAAVVHAFYAALEAEDIEAIMELIADEAEIEIYPGSSRTGKSRIRLDLEFVLSNTDNTFKVSDLQVEGSRVSYSYTLRDDQQNVVEQGQAEVTVERGKIVSARGTTFGSP